MKIKVLLTSIITLLLFIMLLCFCTDDEVIIITFPPEPTTLLPDLVPTEISYPVFAVVGETVSISFTIRNSGDTESQEFNFSIYITPDAFFDPALIYSGTSDALNSYASFTMERDIDIPSHFNTGTYKIYISVDEDDAITEQDEDNNTLDPEVSIELLFEEELPDLAISEVNCPLSMDVKSNQQITAVISNNGVSDIQEDIGYKFILAKSVDTDQPYDPRQIFAGTISEGIAGSGSTDISVSVLIPDTIPDGDYYLLGFVDYNESILESDEGNNADYRSGFVAVNNSKEFPDLAISEISFPASASTGVPANISFKIVNQGQIPATDFKYKVMLCTQSDTSDPGDVYGVAELSKSSLNVSSSFTGFGYVSLPHNIPSGNYFVFFLADSDYALDELSEENNKFVSTGKITVINANPLPDLAIESISHPLEIDAGDEAVIDIDIRNNGLLMSSSTNIRFRLSKDFSIYTDTADSYLTEFTIPALTNGAKYEAAILLLLPDYIFSGNYFLILDVDYGNTIHEACETNNSFLSSEAIAVTNSITIPDLTIQSCEDFPENIAPSDDISINCNILNNEDTASSEYKISVLLSADSSSDTLDLDYTVMTRRYDSIAGSSPASVTIDFSVPDIVPSGSYYPLIFVDPADLISESDESNNILLLTSQTVMTTVSDFPDFIVVDILASELCQSGEDISLTVELKNQGAGDYTSPVGCRIYLSEDNSYESSDDDILLDNFNVAGGILAGQSSITNRVIPFSGSLVQEVESGSYHMFGIVDYYDSIHEENESNNTLLYQSLIYLGNDKADLICGNINHPSSGMPSSNHTLGVVISNQGDAGITNSFTVEFWLSQDNSLITDDDNYSLGTTVINDDLAAGYGMELDYPLFMPSDIPSGSYYIFIELDSGKDIDEKNETNNNSYSSVLYSFSNSAGYSDLSITEISSANSANFLSMVNVDITIQNSGTEPIEAGTDSFKLDIILSQDKSWTTYADNIEVPDFPVSVSTDIPAEDSITVSAEVFIPYTIYPAQYYILSKIDTDNEITELNELNNSSASDEMIIIYTNGSNYFIQTFPNQSTSGYPGRTEDDNPIELRIQVYNEDGYLLQQVGAFDSYYDLYPRQIFNLPSGNYFIKFYAINFPDPDNFYSFMFSQDIAVLDASTAAPSLDNYEPNDMITEPSLYEVPLDTVIDDTRIGDSSDKDFFKIIIP